ncbi:MAG: hypothetical protein KDB14_11675 [Planctomycetales bacterium]|nr:hypothetical protein [Planctomycetales bacterium]
METNDLAATQLIADWSKWLASLQTGVITLIGYSTVAGKVTLKDTVQPGWVICAVFFFLGSLVCASFVLFALPGIVQRLPPPKEKDVLAVGTLNGGGIPLYVFCVGQFIMFVIAIALLAVWAAIQVTHGTTLPNVSTG